MFYDICLADEAFPNKQRMFCSGKQCYVKFDRKSGFLNQNINLKRVSFRVDMSKASHLVYTSHPKSLTNPLLAYNLTKPLT